MILRNNVWHYDFVIGGKRYRGSTGFSKDEKRAALAAVEKIRVQVRESYSVEMIWEQTKRRLIAGTELPMNSDEIWGAFEKLGKSNAGLHRMKIYATRLTDFCNWMKTNYPDVKSISDILPHHAQEWWGYMKKSICSNSTRNDHLTALKLIFGSLGKNYGMVEDPFAGIRKLTQDQVSREAFTPEELRLIGEKATGWIYSLCITALSTGLREGDICMLKKSSVNLETGWITIPKTRKTGVSVEIPILPGLKNHLQECMTNESEYVFPELADLYMNTPYVISDRIKKFFTEIGITETRKEVSGYKKKLSNKDVHSFRHTFVYLAACHGIPFPIVQGIVGHTSPEMTKHYMDHAERDSKAQYLAKLPDYLSSTHVAEEKPDPRKRLSDLAYSLPIDKVNQILAQLNP